MVSICIAPLSSGIFPRGSQLTDDDERKTGVVELSVEILLRPSLRKREAHPRKTIPCPRCALRYT